MTNRAWSAVCVEAEGQTAPGLKQLKTHTVSVCVCVWGILVHDKDIIRGRLSHSAQPEQLCQRN